jgi:hypothetical protein
MKFLTTALSLVQAHLGRALRSLRASPGAWAPRPAPVPIAVRADRGPGSSVQRRRRHGL